MFHTQQLHGNIIDWNKGMAARKRKVWYKFADRMIEMTHIIIDVELYPLQPVKHGYDKDAYAWQWSAIVV
jgi:hypothetical protein